MIRKHGHDSKTVEDLVQEMEEIRETGRCPTQMEMTTWMGRYGVNLQEIEYLWVALTTERGIPVEKTIIDHMREKKRRNYLRRFPWLRGQR